MTAAGMLLIRADRFRSQEKNRLDARQRLIALIRKAAMPPKKRKRTRPTAASRIKRLENKQHRSRIKKLRQFRGDW
jgi:ribosome-associated protein